MYRNDERTLPSASPADALPSAVRSRPPVACAPQAATARDARHDIPTRRTRLPINQNFRLIALHIRTLRRSLRCVCRTSSNSVVPISSWAQFPLPPSNTHQSRCSPPAPLHARSPLSRRPLCVFAQTLLKGEGSCPGFAARFLEMRTMDSPNALSGRRIEFRAFSVSGRKNGHHPRG